MSWVIKAYRFQRIENLLNFKSKNKTHAFIGQKNGVIRYQPVPSSESIADIKHYWSQGYHDTDYGCVRHICLSHDEKFVFSIGNDSNIFACLFNCTADTLEQAKNDPIHIPNKVRLRT